MHKPVFLALGLLLAAAPAFAQRPTPPGSSAGTERPVDHGPFTPQANQAYQGGGVILQGAPGAPPPVPQPTPPGQAPQNAVPVR
jgi:hypothetical protein